MRPPPIGFAHRGARLEHPDNTLVGFARALALGATALETDAWLTADGVVVLDHDGVAGRGPRKRSIGALARADLPAHVPSIEDLLDLCGPGVDLSVDVKDPAAATGLAEAARASGAAERLWLCSPDATTLAGWRALDADLHLVHSTSVAAVTGTRHPYRRLGAAEVGVRLAAHARALRGGGVGTVNLHREGWSPAAVAGVRSAGCRVFAWDAQRRSDLLGCLDLGVDAVYSDDVVLMVALLAERRSEEADG